jgi:hypothetical protein
MNPFLFFLLPIFIFPSIIFSHDFCLFQSTSILSQIVSTSSSDKTDIEVEVSEDQEKFYLKYEERINIIFFFLRKFLNDFKETLNFTQELSDQIIFENSIKLIANYQEFDSETDALLGQLPFLTRTFLEIHKLSMQLANYELDISEILKLSFILRLSGSSAAQFYSEILVETSNYLKTMNKNFDFVRTAPEGIDIYLNIYDRVHSHFQKLAKEKMEQTYKDRITIQEGGSLVKGPFVKRTIGFQSKGLTQKDLYEEEQKQNKKAENPTTIGFKKPPSTPPSPSQE